MSWLRNITTEKANPPHMRPDRSQGVRANYAVRDSVTDPGRHNGFTHEYAFSAKLTISTTFYANQAQLPGRQQLAERAIVELAFAPYTSRRHRLMSAIMDRNEGEAMELLAEIDKEIGV